MAEWWRIGFLRRSGIRRGVTSDVAAERSPERSHAPQKVLVVHNSLYYTP